MRFGSASLVLVCIVLAADARQVSVSGDGSDLQTAVGLAVAGDTLIVVQNPSSPGFYPVVLNQKSGVHVVGRMRPVILPRPDNLDTAVVYIKGSTNCSFAGFEIRGGSVGILAESSSAIALTYNYIHSNAGLFNQRQKGTGICLRGSAPVTVEDNVVVKNENYGLFSDNQNDNAYDSALLIVNNTIGRSTGGAFVQVSIHVHIVNNIFLECSLHAIPSSGSFDYTNVHYNLFWNAGSSSSIDSTNLHTFPSFVDTAAGDYRPMGSSSTVDAGAPQLRDPDGTRSDIGARVDPWLEEYIPELIPFPSLYVTAQRPVFRWHRAGGVTDYEIEVSAASDFSTPVVSEAVTDTFFTPQTALALGSYFWRVKVEYAPYYSISGSLVIVDSLQVIVVAEWPDYYSSIRRPILKWHPVSGATAYTVEMDTSVSFSTPYATVPVADTFYQPAFQAPLGYNYWRVRSNLSSDWTRGLFIIVPDTIPYPAYYAGDTVYSARPVFAWHPVEGATAYTVEIADNPLFDGTSAVPVSDTSFVPLVDLDDGKWYWRVSSSLAPGVYAFADWVNVSAHGGSVLTGLPARRGILCRIVSERGWVCVALEAGELSTVRCLLFDSRGRKVAGATASGSAILDLGRHARGRYFAQISAGAETMVRAVAVR